jgi:hypothetical protein
MEVNQFRRRGNSALDPGAREQSTRSATAIRRYLMRHHGQRVNTGGKVR